MVDGLKPGQRKILFCCFKRNLKKDVKVSRNCTLTKVAKGFACAIGTDHSAQLLLLDSLICIHG
jgi:hypothetical protein